ncbi:PIG-L family deacetylase [Luteolibacter sp. GHJ8]|uniref:PIG-L family deacetylase n=1 Tax=Luteolibacter rhizosphaerae TaxID=2989719 RepID=A0ABT3G0Z7_9BACT|nr:PIG-L family deacetylase [Luteolibacter rhizosphaerae]MCW1913504.1 PIG-L family deacetylase [Luteolibacter rhizosphaerae]
MRALFVHAHYDDYEFTAAGTFERWRRTLPGFRGRVLVCTDGRAGHHFRTREETGALRLAEQEESARLGGYEFVPLRLHDGSIPREACLQPSVEFHAALWKAIRDFEPDYLFCPPLASDPLVGIHNDHQTVAEAVRRVAYMINVPHAFTPEYPADETTSETCTVPVILNVHDSYMSGANACDLTVDVEEVFDLIARLSWCHQSQICEWLPWVGRHNLAAPAWLGEWTAALRQRFERKNRELNLKPGRAAEVFRVTAWGRVPTVVELTRDFPAGTGIGPELPARLSRWRGEA